MFWIVHTRTKLTINTSFVMIPLGENHTLFRAVSVSHGSLKDGRRNYYTRRPVSVGQGVASRGYTSSPQVSSVLFRRRWKAEGGA